MRPKSRVASNEDSCRQDEPSASGNKEAIEDQTQVLAELESSVNEWLDAAGHAFPEAKSQQMLSEIKAQIPALRSLSKKVADLALTGRLKSARRTAGFSMHEEKATPLECAWRSLRTCPSSVLRQPWHQHKKFPELSI
jgi:hypothetical protein